MNLEDIGSLAEIAGAFGVLASILYLAYEVRRNTTMAQRENHRALHEEVHSCLRPAIESVEFAELYVAAMEDLTGLDARERYQFDVYMMSWLQTAEIVLLDYKAGLLEAEIIVPYKAAIAGHLRRPGGSQWWSERRFWFTESGQKEFDKILNDSSIVGTGAGAGLHEA
jgi:hypothetical protein